MSALFKAWNSLVFKTFAPSDDDDFREKYPDYDIPHGDANPKRSPTEEETYGGVPPDEHPLYGRPGFRGSAKKKPLPSMLDPKLVTQEKFDEEEPTLDTRTPPNPFVKTWNNPRRPPTEESSYGDVPPDEHPLYGKEGFRGSEKKKPLPSISDPKEVTQEEFDEEEPTLDTRTPPNPFKKAWYFLKAQPEHQIAGRGTAPPPIRGMMGRRHQTFSPEQMTPQPLDAQGRPHTHVPSESDPERYSAVGTAPWLTHQREEPQGEEVSGRELRHVTRPVEPFREHLESMPEESFLTPSERWQAQQGLEANLRRNVGGQQRGGLMGPMRHKTNVEHGVARGMKLKPRVKQFEEKKPKLTAEGKEIQALNDMMAEMAAATGGAVTHKPMEMPEPEPEPEPEMGPAVGAVARRGSMDKTIRDAPVLVEGPMAPWEHPDPRMGPLENPKFDPN